MSEEALQRGRQWLEELLHLAGFPAQVRPVSSTESQVKLAEAISNQEAAQAMNTACWLEIDPASLSPQQVAILVGEKGTVLDSIQYLTNTILNLGLSAQEQQAYTIELDNYRLRRLTELKAIAEQAAAQVRATAQEFEIQSLSAAERRQVHTFLKTFADLETESRGAEPDRRLVVRLR